MPLLMKALLDGGYLHGDCITVTGKTIAENLAGMAFDPAQDVVRPTSRPITSWAAWSASRAPWRRRGRS